MQPIRNWLAKSGRAELAALTLRNFPGLAILLIVWMLLNASLPNVVLIAMGRIVANATAQVAAGRHSGLGAGLRDDLVVFGVISAAMFCLIPTQRALTAVSRTRLTSFMQKRLIAAVSRPPGIAHLESRENLDRISLAQGSLMSYNPAEAPVALASAVGVRMQGTIACVVVGDFRWWLGLALFVFWFTVRKPLTAAVQRRIRTFGGDAAIMRRATYFENLATRSEAAKELRVFGLGSWVVERLRENWEAGNAVAGKQYAQIFNTVFVFAPFLLGLYLLVCVFLAHVAHDHATATSTLAVTLAVLPLTSYVGQYTADTAGVDWMLSALPPLADLERELRAAESLPVGALAVPRELPRQMIRFEHVGFRYAAASRDVFDDLELDIPASQSTAIVGLNGAGKTTLVKLLGRLHDATSGRITIDGTDVCDYDPSSWQRQLAVVFQDFNQYPLSAYENVAFGAIDDAGQQTDVELAAAQAGALQVVEGLPLGWETVLSKEFAGGSDLSGGQWQRVALARALFAARRGAKVLVLDEPTAWLDVRGEAEFYERFLGITAGLTTVVISHRFSTVRLADWICALEDGRVVERGSHRELMARAGRYAEMYEMQAARFTDSITEGVER